MARGTQFNTVVRGVLVALLLIAVTRDASAERLPIKNYTVADGLTHDRVRNILRDSRGFLWICTIEGLSRFDGYRFVNYGLEHGLPGGNISYLLETRRGQYWVASSNGIGCFNASPSSSSDAGVPEPRFKAYQVGNNVRSNNVRVLFEDRAGQLWAGTGGGLFRWSENEDAFQPFEEGLLGRPNCMVVTLAEDANGSLWIGTTLGLMRLLPDGRLLNFSMVWPRIGESVSPAFVRVDRDGRLWMLHNKGLVVFQPELDATAVSRALPWLTLTRQETCVSLAGRQNANCGARNTELNNAPMRAPHLALGAGEAWLYLGRSWTTSETGLVFHQTADGQIWIGTDLGLFAFDGISFRNYTTADGLSENVIVALNEDSDGNLWLGGLSTGAMKIVRQGFTSFTKADGVGNLRVVGIGADQSGAVYATSADWFISRFDGQRFSAVQPRLPLPMLAEGWHFTQSSFQDHAGEWWVPTPQGLYRFPKVERIEQLARTRPNAVYTTRDGLPEDIVGYLFEDSRGDLWLGSNDAAPLTRWERATDTFHSYNAAGGLPASGASQSFCQDINGNVWIGFADGLARYRAGRFNYWKAADGLPNGIIRDLYSDHAGRIWIASSLGGVGRVDDPGAETPRFQIHTVADGLASNATRCLTEDKWGRIYIGVGRGVDRLDPTTGRIKHYTTADGLANSFVNAAYRDRDGHLWFGMLQGLSHLIPEPDHPAQPVPVWINGLHIAGAAYKISEFGETDISLPALEASQNLIQIDFFGLAFSVSEPLHYQYKLEGAGQDWSAPTQQRTHEMSLGPGSYRFLVRAVHPDSPLASTPASVTFRILPPIWLRWWFITIAAFVVALPVYAFARYRYQRIKAVLEAQEALRRSREERLAELERVRRRIAIDLHDDIGSSLTRISLLSEVAQRQTGNGTTLDDGPLSTIAGLSRELVDSMSDIVWAINPEKDHLNDLTQRMRRFASDVFTARQIEFHFAAPTVDQDIKVGANVRREVFLIFKEAVNNLVRHSGCTGAEVALQADGEALRLSVSDNGSGFDASKKSRGHGLSSMRERTEALGGEVEVESSERRGTCLRFTIPLVQPEEMRSDAEDNG